MNGAGAQVGPVLRPAIGIAVVSVILTLLGRTTAAILVLGGGVLLVQGLGLSPWFRSGFHRVQHRLAHGVGLVLNGVLLGGLYLVALPAALLARLLGSSRLRGQGRWVPRPGVTNHAARVFADDRRTTASASGAGHQRTVQVVVAVLMVEAILLAGWWAYQERTAPRDPVYAGASTVGALESAALAGQDWVPDAAAEIGAAAGTSTYTPYTGYSLNDHTGRYVNVENRARRTLESSLDSDEPLEVWFFGGSVMFGFDLLRDDHTIPSEVVRLADAAGVPIRARNYGAPGYVNYQETVLLSELVTGGGRPDLVVFYDGINDVSLQLLNGLLQLPGGGEPDQLQAQMTRDAIAESDEVPLSSNQPPAPLFPSPPTVPLTAQAVVDDVNQVMRAGMALSEALADRYDFEVLHYWQPDLYSRAELDPGELALLDGLGLDEERLEVMSALLAAVRAGLPPGITDLGAAMDDVPGPVYSDNVHINESGARAAAAAMYETLGPVLDRLQP